jgi:hypothetical protein
MADYERVREQERLKRFGERFCYYRTQVKKLTRPEVIKQVNRILEQRGLVTEKDDKFCVKSESWLAQVERGEKQKLSSEMRDILQEALGCTAAERLELKLVAGDPIDSMLTSLAGTSQEFLLQLMLTFDAVQHDIITHLQAFEFNSSLDARSERDQQALVLDIIEMALSDFRERLGQRE